MRCRPSFTLRPRYDETIFFAIQHQSQLARPRHAGRIGAAGPLGTKLLEEADRVHQLRHVDFALIRFGTVQRAAGDAEDFHQGIVGRCVQRQHVVVAFDRFAASTGQSLCVMRRCVLAAANSSTRSSLVIK